MQSVEFNYIRNIFPFISSSKFNFITFTDQPSIRCVDFTVVLNSKKNVLPEIVFWVFFSINFKRSFVFSFLKKKYYSGKRLLTKFFLTLNKRFSSKKNSIVFIIKIYKKILLFCQELKFQKIYPLKPFFAVRTLLFENVTFDENYHSLINLAPKFWCDYNFQLFLYPRFNNGLHFRFFLQNIQLPVS